MMCKMHTPVRLAPVPAWRTGEHTTACDYARVSLSTCLASPQPRSHPTRPRRAAHVATNPPESVADPGLREAKCRRRARHRGGWLVKHRPTGSYILIIDGTTETDLTLDEVENALFPPTEVMATRLAPRLALPRKGWDLTVSQKLRVARDLVAQGWTAGGLVSLGMDGRYKYCARGALNKAFLGRATTDAEFRPDDELRLAQRLVAEAMYGRFLDEPDSAVRVAISNWNDSQLGTPRAWTSVVAAFDAAIAECERLEDDAGKARAE